MNLQTILQGEANNNHVIPTRLLTIQLSDETSKLNMIHNNFINFSDLPSSLSCVRFPHRLTFSHLCLACLVSMSPPSWPSSVWRCPPVRALHRYTPLRAFSVRTQAGHWLPQGCCLGVHLLPGRRRLARCSAWAGLN